MAATKRKHDTEYMRFNCMGLKTFTVSRSVWREIKYVTTLLDVDPDIKEVMLDQDPTVFQEVLNVIIYNRPPPIESSRYADIMHAMRYLLVESRQLPSATFELVKYLNPIDKDRDIAIFHVQGYDIDTALHTVKPISVSRNSRNMYLVYDKADEMTVIERQGPAVFDMSIAEELIRKYIEEFYY